MCHQAGHWASCGIYGTTRTRQFQCRHVYLVGYGNWLTKARGELAR